MIPCVIITGILWNFMISKFHLHSFFVSLKDVSFVQETWWFLITCYYILRFRSNQRYNLKIKPVTEFCILNLNIHKYASFSFMVLRVHQTITTVFIWYDKDYVVGLKPWLITINRENSASSKLHMDNKNPANQNN